MNTHPPLFRPILLALGVVGVLLATLGCETRRVDNGAREVNAPVREVDPALRGTIGSQVRISGLTPQYVSGIGLVVGLEGTGSAEVPASVRAWLVSEMTKLGVGARGTSLEDITPDMLIDDPGTAVVRVEAVIPPAAPQGLPFDVLVSAFPGSSTTSLDGGRLWTTDLYRGIFVPGTIDTKPLATAEGELFINPFVAPGDTSDPRTAVVRTRGRILSGGRVDGPYNPTLILDNPSHARARAIAASINSRFGRGGARDPVAIGKNEDIIEIRVPERYAGRAGDFFEVVKHMRVQTGFDTEYARRYADVLVERPELAKQMKWSLVALGRSSLEFVRPLYRHPERIPRLAALEVGAELGDPLASPALIELATQEGPDRLRAIDLLGKLPASGAANSALRELLTAGDPAVRVRAYEALEVRGDPIIRQRIVGKNPRKFVLHRIEAGEPMIYATQNLVPRIAIFGESARFTPGAFMTAWNRRLMIDTDESGRYARIFYRSGFDGRPIEHEVDADVVDFVRYLAHRETDTAPVPGLDLTYSQVVGAVYAAIEGGAIDAQFTPEADVLENERLKALNDTSGTERPELSSEGPIDAYSPLPFGPGIGASVDDGLTDQERRAREARRQRYVVRLRAAPDDALGEAIEEEVRRGTIEREGTMADVEALLGPDAVDRPITEPQSEDGGSAEPGDREPEGEDSADSVDPDPQPVPQ